MGDELAGIPDPAVGDQFQKHSYPFSIMINATGRRFVDEGADFRNYTYAKYGRVVLSNVTERISYNNKNIEVCAPPKSKSQEHYQLLFDQLFEFSYSYTLSFSFLSRITRNRHL